MIRIVSIIMFIFLSSCGIKKYRVFELKEAKNRYTLSPLYADTTINIEIGVSAYDNQSDISIFIGTELKKWTTFTLDSVFSTIQFLEKDKKLSTDYILQTININSHDTSVIFHAFDKIPIKNKELRIANKVLKYQLTYWSASHSTIPKKVKNMTVDIYMEYHVGDTFYKKNFTVVLQQKTHRSVWFIRNC